MDVQDSPLPSTSRSCPVVVQRVIGIIVAFHLICLVSEPLCNFSRTEYRGISPEFLAIRSWGAPYIEGLYLDHGYFFFAPTPVPSHLVEYGLGESPKNNRNSTQSGESPAVLEPDPNRRRFPDRTRQWPRLLYHRYFMLSEFYDQNYVPPNLSIEAQKDEVFFNRWRTRRNRYEQIQASIQRSLEYSEQSPISALTRLERQMPDEYQFFVEHLPIDDPKLLIALPETIDTPPASDAIAIPAPVGENEQRNARGGRP